MMRFVYWQEEGSWLGFLEESPNYWTQGATIDELTKHLRSLFEDLRRHGDVPVEAAHLIVRTACRDVVMLRRSFDEVDARKRYEAAYARSQDPQWVLKWLRSMVWWCDEHYLSYRNLKDEDKKQANEELLYLGDSILQAIRLIDDLSDLLKKRE